VGQRLAEITQTFSWMALRYLPGGAGGPIAAKCKKSNSQNSKFQKIQNPKSQKSENFRRRFFREIDREILFKRWFCSHDRRQHYRFFAFCPPLMCEVHT
jgi:hypothetical protein